MNTSQGGTAHADVVDRTYQARIQGAHLLLDGEYDGHGQCPNPSIAEHWDFTPSSVGLKGTLTSRWKLPPDCRWCEQRFELSGKLDGSDPGFPLVDDQEPDPSIGR
jgi:hypothetical protein